jgi:hypothetical protein
MDTGYAPSPRHPAATSLTKAQADDQSDDPRGQWCCAPLLTPAVGSRTSLRERFSHLAGVSSVGAQQDELSVVGSSRDNWIHLLCAPNPRLGRTH